MLSDLMLNDQTNEITTLIRPAVAPGEEQPKDEEEDSDLDLMTEETKAPR